MQTLCGEQHRYYCPLSPVPRIDAQDIHTHGIEHVYLVIRLLNTVVGEYETVLYLLHGVTIWNECILIIY